MKTPSRKEGLTCRKSDERRVHRSPYLFPAKPPNKLVNTPATCVSSVRSKEDTDWSHGRPPSPSLSALAERKYQTMQTPDDARVFIVKRALGESVVGLVRHDLNFGETDSRT